ncbi:MAG: DNA polymerase IV [Bacilli bacterium]|nr:DNA polymerase IV [Bacilli bacterium]
MSRIIAHIDLNAFFASAEVLRDQTLKGKPLIIGGKGRAGIVSTCSYKAREYGIHSGMPTFQALRLCPNVIILPPDFPYYSKLSKAFFDIVRRYTPLIEVASIDECYADFTEVMKGVKDPVSYFQSMQNTLLRETGLTASIGVAVTKWLAKMASDMKKPMGLTFLAVRDIPKILYPMPIESFWGIGKKTAPKLREIGIGTIGDLARLCKEEDPALMATLGKFFYTVKDWIRGKGSDELTLVREDPKSIGASTTLPYDMNGYGEVRPSLEEVAKEVSDRAKKAKMVGHTVTLTVKDTVGSFHLHTRAKSLDKGTNDFNEIYECAKELYLKEFDGKMEIRLVGVSLSKLEDPKKATVQMTLWDYEEYEKSDATILLIEKLNRKLDKPLLKRASEAENRKKGK